VVFQVHKETIDKVANSIPGKGNIELEIYGMEGIPDEDLIEHERHKLSKGLFCFLLLKIPIFTSLTGSDICY
jgi:hypothetical protein